MGDRSGAGERARAPERTRAPACAAAVYEQAWVLVAGVDKQWMMMQVVEDSPPAALCVCYCLTS